MQPTHRDQHRKRVERCAGQSVTATQWQRALSEARVARQVVETWLSYGYDRAALLQSLGVASLRDRTPLLQNAAASLALSATGYRIDVVDGWTAQQLTLNDAVVASRGSYDTTGQLNSDAGSGAGGAGYQRHERHLRHDGDRQVYRSHLQSQAKASAAV